MKKILAIALFGLTAVVPITVLPAVAQSSVAAEQTTTFDIENMTCALCPVTVKRAMEGVEGVQSVAVDFDAKTATVTFDTGMTDPDAIAAASANAGYPAHVTG